MYLATVVIEWFYRHVNKLMQLAYPGIPNYIPNSMGMLHVVKVIYFNVFTAAPPSHLNSLLGQPATPSTESPNQNWVGTVLPTGKFVAAII